MGRGKTKSEPVTEWSFQYQVCGDDNIPHDMAVNVQTHQDLRDIIGDYDEPADAVATAAFEIQFVIGDRRLSALMWYDEVTGTWDCGEPEDYPSDDALAAISAAGWDPDPYVGDGVYLSILEVVQESAAAAAEKLTDVLRKLM